MYLTFRHKIIGTMVAFLLTATFSVVRLSAQEPSQKSSPEITLQMAMVLPTPSTLAFTLKNTGLKNVQTTPIATNYNRIVIVPPDGKAREVFVWKRFLKLPIDLKPGQSITWKADVAGMMERKNMKTPGLYRLSWMVEGVRSQEILLLKQK